ncbi:MAG: ATP-binding protein [Bacteroidia bacterium]
MKKNARLPALISICLLLHPNLSSQIVTHPDSLQPGNFNLLEVENQITNQITKQKDLILLFSISSSLFLFIALLSYNRRTHYKRKAEIALAELKKQKEMEQLRKRISSDIHDDIGAHLTRILLMSDLIKAKSKINSEEVIDLIEKVKSTSKEVLYNLGEIVWNVNPAHDNLICLLAFMRTYTNNFFEDTRIKCHINFPLTEINNNVDADVKRNLFLVFKEALNNIVKHSGAHNVFVNFEWYSDVFELEISDDGKGMTISPYSSSGNGLRNMHTRMKSINGTVKFSSTPGLGTTIYFKGTLKVHVERNHVMIA